MSAPDLQTDAAAAGHAADASSAAVSGASDPAASDRARHPLAKLSERRSAAVLNCLTESTFFYREDDPDAFDYLRRHRADFARWFEAFRWDIHVDRQCARLFKRRQYNAALTPRQRSHFDLTRRDSCLLFMLLLEFHELELARQNVHFEQDEDLFFLLADFVTHAIGRYKKELGDSSPTERDIVREITGLFRVLERHRFIRAVEKEDAARDEVLAGGQTEHVLYAFLPGIRCYDPTRLNRPVFADAYGGADATNGVNGVNGAGESRDDDDDGDDGDETDGPAEAAS